MQPRFPEDPILRQHYVEQLLLQLDVDVKRLWKRIPQIQDNEVGSVAQFIDQLTLVEQQLSGGGGGGCAGSVVKIWYVGNEFPTGGSVTVPMSYDGASGSPSWAYNASQATVASAIASALSTVTTGDITVAFGGSTTAGTAFGTWPITITFPDIDLWSANGDITDSFTFSSGTVPHAVMGDICCV